MQPRYHGLGESKPDVTALSWHHPHIWPYIVTISQIYYSIAVVDCDHNYGPPPSPPSLPPPLASPLASPALPLLPPAYLSLDEL